MQVEVYEVEEIIQERSVPRGSGFVTEYKVKWKGYSAAQATWEPLENLDGCRELVRKFQEKQKMNKPPKLPSKEKMKQKAPPKPKITQQEIKGEKDILTAYRNDFYFSDESNLNQQHDDRGMEVESRQAPSHIQSSFEVSQKIDKPKSKDSPQDSVEKGKRGRKKKERDSQLFNQKEPRLELPGREAKSGKKPMEEIRKPTQRFSHRAIERQQMQQSTYRYKSVRREQITQRTVSTQTSLLTKTDCGMKVVSMHTSLEFPRKVWFTVEQNEKFIEISREKLIWSNPRALYNFYHEHYLKGRAKREEMEEEMMGIMHEHISGKVLEDSESDSDGSGPLDYFTIAQEYDLEDPRSRKKFEKLIRGTTFKPKTDKSLLN